MRQFIVSLSLLGLFAALPAAALTYVRMTDGALADASPVIVEVEILGASQGRAGSLPVTEYRTEVRQILKGVVAAGELLVRVPGGEIEGGMSLHLWGAPAFKAGDQALLFLTPGSEGTFVINQLALGAFHLRADGADRWAVRDLKEATAMTRDGLPDLSVEAARDYDLFRRWLEDREAGLGRLPDYFAALPTWKLESIQDRFTLFETDGKNFRWQQFDEDDHVDWHAHEDGQPGLTGGGFSQFQAALAIWTDDAITNIDYRYGGTTDKTGGLTDPCDFDPGPDGVCTLSDPQVNSIIFDDPNNNRGIFGSAFNCATGGVIAAGGPWFSRDNTHQYLGKVYISIVSADIVTNENVGCFLSGGKTAEEVFAHELGHTLGLGHSCGDGSSGACDTSAKDNALMRASAHGGNRGGALGSDDRAGAAALYSPVGDLICPPDAPAIFLQNDRFKVTGCWSRINDTSGVATGVKLTPDTGTFWFSNQNNVEVVVKVLNGCRSNGHYWVFAGGLTNAEVLLKVTDTVTDTLKIYRNPQRAPFQPIQDALAFDTCP